MFSPVATSPAAGHVGESGRLAIVTHARATQRWKVSAPLEDSDGGPASESLVYFFHI